MLLKQTLCSFLLLFIGTDLFAQQAANHLTFNRPASSYLEAMPLGNGRIGAMDFGGTNKNRIILNEKSLWSGGIQDADNDSAHLYLPEIQDLLLKGDNKAAQELLQKKFVSKGTGSGYGQGANDHYGCYQILGDLWIQWQDTTSKISDYHRQLQLDKALATTTWKRGGVEFSQETFVSMAGNFMAVEIKSSKKNGIGLFLNLSRAKDASVSRKQNFLVMKGQLLNKDKKGMRYASAICPVVKDGSVRFSEKGIEIKNASSVVIYFSAATDYNIDDPGKPLTDPLSVIANTIEKALKQTFIAAKTAHIQAYSPFYQRSSFTLNNRQPDIEKLSTEERLAAFSKGNSDAQLPVLYYNFGKYLLICSSQKGTLPANLQGIWAPEYQTPWNGDYHLNINLQMNYWLAEPMGLGDLADPLFEYTASLVAPGEKTAKAYYNAPGWVAHVIANPWKYTSPGEGADWGSTLTGGAWLCEHIWEHYRFTGDKNFLKKYYPVLKGAAQFLSSILIKEPKHGWLVTAPSNSPEHAYITPEGFEGNTCMGPTMDMQICREVFDYTIKAAKILNTDPSWADSLQIKRNALAPLQIGAAGDVNEWLEDWKDSDPHHRHTSHLYGLHPYDEITPWDSPEMAAAARKTLEQRGDGGTGWSKAWKINFWARLGDGDHALVLLKQLLKPTGTFSGVNYGNAGGTYPNLFCAHPPFQIDGNFGGAAGIGEMLVQSQGKEEVIRLLPALPGSKDWADGSIKGFRTRGGFKIDMNWENGRVTQAAITALKSGKCRLLLPEGKTLDLKIPKNQLQEKNGILEFAAIEGNTYLLTSK
ncbi:alpha-L-fucosidase [Pedobacter sp. HMWF019]|uniref:glycoside hydrolase family 95 protein n=1 Tax=Pedobacter sp. HMWF019 TaxID=2056856 RepID=UPI000D397064|nr:glycoside hydrolase family 95 protein [Pedobacter sp. HMWF019]PTT00785.1 alpha-L-fucosidase [Pedobacter sp. HMWF019]